MLTRPTVVRETDRSRPSSVDFGRCRGADSKSVFIAQRIFMAPQEWNGRGAENRHHGPPRCRQDVLSSQGHRDASGRRTEGRRHDHGADYQTKSARGLLRDGLGLEGAAGLRVPRDPVEDHGRPIRRGHQRARGGRGECLAVRDRERRCDRDRRGREDGGRVPELRPGGEGRPGCGQAPPAHAAQEVPQPIAAGHPPSGRRADPGSDPSESQPPALQDREADEGRGPLRTKGYPASGASRLVMPFPFPTKEVREGAAQLLVPDVPRRKGPGTAGPWPFYNPTMTVNRDMAAMALAKWPRPLESVLDGLSATGAWGIRMHLESGPVSIAFNDRSDLATDLIRENLRRNGITGEVTRGDLRTLLRDASFDFVDIDPFGTPEPYVGSLLESAPIGSGFGLTATDTSVLGGTYPDTCVKRYGARPVRCPQGTEIGLRILLGFCEREAARFGKGVRPLVSFAAEHFLRIFGLVEGR